VSGQIFYVYGPPGTGKTTYLSRQARRAAAEHGPTSVAIASLTRAAAAEIAGRDTGIPEDLVGTLHAHCYRALERPELAETPEGIRAWNEAHPHAGLSRGVNQLEDTIGESGGPGAGDDVHHQVMTLRARMVPRERWTIEQRSHDANWEDFKAQTGRLDFTDLIERCLAEVPAHPAHPKVLLLDEAQDFSRLELALAQRWAAAAQTTVLCGDPDQSIYTWRGASTDAIERLSIPDEHTRVLSQSYRVPRAVHSRASKWVSQIEGRKDVGYAARDADGAFREAAGVSLRSPERLTEALLEALSETAGSVMVLATCRYMLAPLLAVLRKQGVPFHNPYRSNDGSWNPMRAANRLKAFLAPDDRVWGAQARSWTWEDLRLWTDPLQARGNLARGAKTLIESKCQRDRFGESRAHEVVDLDTLPQLFGAEVPDHPAYRLDVDWYFDALRADGHKTLAYPIEVLRRRGPAALAETPRLVVGTGHSVKGGEADTVFVAPDLSVTGYWHGWHAGGPGRDAIVRLLYVMMTRAHESVVLLDPSGAEHVPGELLAEGIEEAMAA
jgi:superfamily I DNA/RNA helicase